MIISSKRPQGSVLPCPLSAPRGAVERCVGVGEGDGVADVACAAEVLDRVAVGVGVGVDVDVDAGPAAEAGVVVLVGEGLDVAFAEVARGDCASPDETVAVGVSVGGRVRVGRRVGVGEGVTGGEVGVGVDVAVGSPGGGGGRMG
jgi:hypothetical protein